MIGFRCHVPEEIIEVVKVEPNDYGSAVRFRNAKALLKFGINEGLVEDQIPLSRTEPDRDSFSALDHFLTHRGLTLFARSNGSGFSCNRQR